MDGEAADAGGGGADAGGVCARTFRRYVDRFEESGLDGLADKRLSQVSARRAPTDEVLRLEALYRESHQGWSVAHFHDVYRERHAGERSYTWVRNRLQEAGLAAQRKRRGTPRRRRERAPIPGLLVHQDGSSHEWVPATGCAQRVRQRIAAVMKASIADGHRLDNPAGDALTAVLPKGGRKQRHQRALPHREVGAALEMVRRSNAQTSTKLAFEFLVLTAARSGEVRLMT